MCIMFQSQLKHRLSGSSMPTASEPLCFLFSVSRHHRASKSAVRKSGVILVSFVSLPAPSPLPPHTYPMTKFHEIDFQVS